MLDSDEVITLQVPAQARYIRLARLVGAGLANDLDIDLDALDDVRLAIGEACALAVQFGAAAIDMQFLLRDGTLTVRGDGRRHESDNAGEATDPDQRSDGADDEQLRLVRQILDVACAEHELTLDETGIEFSLTFTHGT